VIRIRCPFCHDRNSSEFRYVGGAAARPDVSTTSPEQWRRYLYDQRNAAGWTTETWYHAMGCEQYLLVERHTVSNEIRSVIPVASGAIDTGPAQ
jgi:sarcosine oxidase, subunit delta